MSPVFLPLTFPSPVTCHLEVHRCIATVVADCQTHLYRIGTNLCTYVFALDGEAVSKVGAVADEVEGHAQAVERPAEGEVLLGRVAQHVHQQFLALLQFLCLPFPNLRLPCLRIPVELLIKLAFPDGIYVVDAATVNVYLRCRDCALSI